MQEPIAIITTLPKPATCHHCRKPALEPLNSYHLCNHCTEKLNRKLERDFAARQAHREAWEGRD